MTDCDDRDYDTIDSLQPEIPHIELNTPTRADLEGDGYSDPRYHGEVDQERGSSTECGPQTKVTDENVYTLPDLCDSNAAAYINTPTRADLEAEGYSDPRYYGDWTTRGTTTDTETLVIIPLTPKNSRAPL